MRRTKILAVVCVALFVVAYGARAQTFQHLKEWENLTNPGGAARVGDTIQFTINIIHGCPPSCEWVAVDLQDDIEYGLLLLEVGDDCIITESGFQCLLDGPCYDIEPTYLTTRFRARVLFTGQRCNQSFATAVACGSSQESSSNEVCFTAAPAADAENIDPDGDGSQNAWAENVGWINAEPLGHGGPGVQVHDFELTGYMWGENVGWVSLSCKNESTCGTT